ncbi:serine/threonine-protein kinase HipA [Janthinobacterium psychrotolerans]|uniref:Serine/threonine-protein kinase HipA n=1 Tax=Janthinobacterium psychrotolerans TaxID=1747903 RepID=A0A1A7C7Q9_9BURK|nr:HipA domain-containing protein [Janthinobacterium psychrotolerans]OBV40348.1 serine/threonine-protein kinase HipA [Janthinobacterium psychrotolerans]
MLDLTGEVDLGVAAATYLVYLPDYAIRYWKSNDAAALSVNVPVDLESYAEDRWPAFLADLLPQGYGRIELLKQLKRDGAAGPAADWALLCAGAGNPIGNLRIKEAHAWIMERSGNRMRGFSTEEVAARADDFNEYLAQHGLFLAGSSGVQGEWPKILLTQAHDGLFYLDHTLPDEEAKAHYIVKFGRGKDEALANILRLEAPYMQLAKGLGLDVHADLMLHERALFIPRFDRAVTQDGVVRQGQESIASLCGIGGFGRVPSHNDVCGKLGEVATDPTRDIIEYIKRDVANIVLGNKDNHARNTAIQRRHDGTMALTPLFDFAPMWLHPDGIARRMRWQGDDGGSPVWRSVIEQACAAAQVNLHAVTAAVAAMALPLSTLFDDARALGIEERFLAPMNKALDNVRAQLENL